MLKKVTLLGLATASAFALNTAEININDTDLELSLKIDASNYQNNIKAETTFFGARVLKADSENSSNTDESSNVYGEINFLRQQALGNDGLSVGLGVKANYTRFDSQNFMSIPLGVEAKYKLPIDSSVAMYLGTSAYYAPRVLSFGDAENFFEFRANFDVEVIDNGMITFGYRSLDTNYDVKGGDYTYNQSVYGGFKFAF